MIVHGITMKEQAQNMGETCSAHVLSMFWACSFYGNSMNNHLSYCGFIDATISASEKDLPICISNQVQLISCICL